MELSLITRKLLEMNGKKLVDIKIQTKTDQMKTLLQPIPDTNSSATVGHVGLAAPDGVQFLLVAQAVLSADLAFFPVLSLFVFMGMDSRLFLGATSAR